MKNIQIILSLLLILNGYGSDLTRSWTSEKGNVFLADFVKVKGSSVALKNEAGKTINIPIKDLGIVDRYYLRDKHNVPLKALQGGNILTAEQKYKPSKDIIKNIKPIVITGDGYKLSLQGYITPTALFLYQKGLKIKEVVETFQKAQFSHQYRHPNHDENRSSTRRVYLYLDKNADEVYEALGRELVERFKKEGKKSTLEINQFDINWSRNRNTSRWVLPSDLVKEYNTQHSVDIEFAKKGKQEGSHEYFFYRTWSSIWKTGHNLNRSSRIKKSTNNGKKEAKNDLAYSLRLALLFNNDLRSNGVHEYRIGGARDNSDVYRAGNLGERKVWAADIANKVKSGEIKADFNVLTKIPKNKKPAPIKNYKNYGSLLLGAGRFMESDLRHMIGTARLCAYIDKNRRAPSLEELAKIYEYSSLKEMNLAFEEFLLKRNLKMKP